MNKRNIQYVNFLDLGCNVTMPSPSYMSTFSGSQNKLLNGELGFIMGPETKPNQIYNAQKAAINYYDPDIQYFLFPELFPTMTGQYPPKNTPNLGSPYIGLNTCGDNLWYGDHLVENAILYKYGEFLNLITRIENIIPSSPDSALVDIPIGAKGVNIVIDPQTIDNDPLMNELIRRYYTKGLGKKIIQNIYLTSKQKGINISNTKIGKLGEVLSKLY